MDEKKEVQETWSMNRLLESEELYWIKSIPTLRKWVQADIKGPNYLKTITIANTGSGIRYYFKPENVEIYRKAFEDGLVTNE